MIRRAPTSAQASAAFVTALFAFGLASAQDGNPLDRPRPKPETSGGPAWAGIFGAIGSNHAMIWRPRLPSRRFSTRPAMKSLTLSSRVARVKG